MEKDDYGEGKCRFVDGGLIYYILYTEINQIHSAIWKNSREEAPRLLDQVGKVVQKPGGTRPVDDTVVA